MYLLPHVSTLTEHGLQHVPLLDDALHDARLPLPALLHQLDLRHCGLQLLLQLQGLSVCLSIKIKNKSSQNTGMIEHYREDI